MVKNLEVKIKPIGMKNPSITTRGGAIRAGRILKIMKCKTSVTMVRAKKQTPHIPHAARYVPQPGVRIADRIVENRRLSKNFPVFAYLKNIGGHIMTGRSNRTAEKYQTTSDWIIVLSTVQIRLGIHHIHNAISAISPSFTRAPAGENDGGVALPR
ncbi:MAG: hypothetical protein Q7J09_07410 [Methanocalculus sp.]|uniref:hypothetical protein n=1 Tax=Methanocalculus sp. TaxID=2004547 RepID=UPI00271654A1|nr:hypothetical protein [Methanocalculus sp.]MDO9539812.1 hypothetical protein [Methanocalculus sp.]